MELIELAYQGDDRDVVEWLVVCEVAAEQLVSHGYHGVGQSAIYETRDEAMSSALESVLRGRQMHLHGKVIVVPRARVESDEGELFDSMGRPATTHQAASSNARTQRGRNDFRSPHRRS